MRQSEKVGLTLNNSRGRTSDIKYKRFYYRAMMLANLKDFATKICKVKNYAYLCSAKEPNFGYYKVIRTLFERVPVALLHPQLWFFGENKRDTLSFCIY